MLFCAHFKEKMLFPRHCGSEHATRDTSSSLGNVTPEVFIFYLGTLAHVWNAWTFTLAKATLASYCIQMTGMFCNKFRV